MIATLVVETRSSGSQPLPTSYLMVPILRAWLPLPLVGRAVLSLGKVNAPPPKGGGFKLVA